MSKRWPEAFGVAALMVLSACSSGPREGEGDAAALDEATDQIAQTDPTPADGAELQGSVEQPPSLDEAASLQGADPSTAPTDAPVAEAPPSEAPAADASIAPPAEVPPAAETVAGLDASAPAPVAPGPPEPVNETPAITSETQDYTVQSGDTLMKIAFDTYGDVYQWRKIYEANRDRISDPNRIPHGTVLKLEKSPSNVAVERNGEKFQIRQGDTLGKIAAQVYGTPKKWRKIYENNRTLIKDPNRIFAGFYLYYTITPQEREEAEKLRQERAAPPAESPPPLAGNAPVSAPAAIPAVTPPPASGVGDRMPASVSP